MLRSQGPKRATFIRVTTPIDVSKLKESMEKLVHRDCGKTQEESWGFVPPDEEARWGLMASTRRYHLLTLRHDRRVVPKGRLSREWRKMIKEAETRSDPPAKLTKDERLELKEDAKRKLFPFCTPSEDYYQAIYMEEHGYLVVLEKSLESAGFVVTKINRALQSQNIEIKFSPKAVQPELKDTLTAWAYNPNSEPQKHGFEVGTALRLVNNAETAVLTNQDVDTEEVRAHLHSQKEVEHIALIWADTVDFILSSVKTLSHLNFKKYCSETLKAARDEGKEDLMARQEGEFLVYMGALWDLWGAVDGIPTN